MLTTYAPPPPQNQVVLARSLECGVEDQQPSISMLGVTSGCTLEDFSVGNTHYRLMAPIQLEFSWDHTSSAFICWANELGNVLQGTGATPAIAAQEFEQVIHAGFQALYSKRPFEMDEQETRMWRTLINVINVSRYREGTPIAYRQLGKVRFGHLSYPSKIDWIDGRTDNISLDQVTAEVAGSRPGQWIDAVIKRDRNTGWLKSIDYAQKIPEPPRPSISQAENFWNNLPVSDAPESDWNWPDE